jgi:hypothetical protein
MFITKYHKNINMTGATSGAGTPYPSLSQDVLMYITHVNEVHTCLQPNIIHQKH